MHVITDPDQLKQTFNVYDLITFKRMGGTPIGRIELATLKPNGIEEI
jgi:hypothetical protein